MARPKPFALRILAAATAAGACQSAPTGPVSVPLAEATSARVFWTATGADWTSHIPLTIGYTVRLKVRLYVADGREITPLPNPVQLSASVTPPALATATTADSVLLLLDVTPTAPPDSSGNLSITITEPGSGTMKTFGPFFMLVHDTVAAR